MNAKTPLEGTSPNHLMELFNERASAGDLEGLLELYEPDAVFRRSAPRLGGSCRLTDVIQRGGEPGDALVDAIRRDACE